MKLKIKQNRLAKNYIYNLLYKTTSILIPLILAPYLSKHIGAEGIGTYAYYYAIAHYFYLFGKMGLNNYGAREIAMSKENLEDKNYTFSAIYYQQILVAGIIFLIYLIYCLINLKNSEYTPLIFGIYTIGCLIDIDWLYTGSEKFDTIAKKNIITKLASLIAVFIFVKQPEDLWKYVLIMSLGMLTGYITLWFNLKKEIKFVKVKFSDITKHIKPNLILLFPVLAANVYHSIDKIMVGNMYSMTELGYYENSEKIVYAINSFITAFTTLMMPKCSILLSQKKHDKCIKNIEDTFFYLYLIIMLMASVCAGISDKIILVVFSESFTRSIIILELLIVTIPFMIWTEIIRAMWIIPNKKDKIFLTSLSVGAILDIIFNYILIPKYGAIGASIGTIIAEISVPIIQYILLRKELNYKKFIKIPFVFLISSILNIIIMNNIQKYFKTNIISLLSLLIIGTIIYTIITIILLYVFNRKKLNEYYQQIKKKIIF